jgi:hypothetical protein
MQICILLVSKLLIALYVLNDPKICIRRILRLFQRILRLFQINGNYWKKESYFPKLLQVGSIEDKLQFCTLFVIVSKVFAFP